MPHLAQGGIQLGLEIGRRARLCPRRRFPPSVGGGKALFPSIQPVGPGLRPCQFRPGQTERAQSFQQPIPKTRKQQTKLVGPLAVTTRPVGKQPQLLFLDPVFHLTPRTIDFFGFIREV